MKYIFLFIIAAALAGCAERKPTEIVVKNNLNGLQFVHQTDKFEAANGQYHIYTMLRNTGKSRLKSLQLNAAYLDANGKQVASSIGGPESELMPGDSAVVSTSWMFPTEDKLPAKVILSASN